MHQNKVTMQPYLHDEICKMTHTYQSCSIQILASTSSFKLTQEKDTERVETYPLKKSLLLEEKGKAKGGPSVTEKL
jgi:hypothetical protein